jgi:DMSO/TMAO reductase YedYZ heme-binding membrane subunit
VPSWALRAVVIGAILVLIGAATPQGGAVAGDVQRFLSYYAGVFTLLALTTAVVSGLLATERLVLKIRHRVLAQAVHRAATVLAVTFVIAHILVKVVGGLAFPAQTVVPGTGPIGYGALAFDLLLVVVASGLLRARFARAASPWVWRSVHALAYLSWPLAIVHGLTAGRSAPAWATLSYVLSVAVVALAVLTRMIVVVKPREVRRAGDLISEPAPAGAEARQGAGREAPGREAAGRRGAVRGAARAPDTGPVDLRGDGDPKSSEVMR